MLQRDFARMTDAERNVPLLNPGFLSDNDTKAGLADADESEEDVSEEDVSEEYESTPPMPARRAVKAPQSTPRSTKQASLHYMGQHQGSSSGHAAKGRAQADGQHLDLTSRSAPVGNTKVRRWSSRRSSTSSSGSSLPDLTQIFAGKGAGADGAKRRKPTSGEMGNSGMDASTDEERTMQVESRPIASSSASPRRPRAASPSSTPFEAHSIVRRKPQPASARRVPAQSVSTRPGPSNARDATLLNGKFDRSLAEWKCLQLITYTSYARGGRGRYSSQAVYRCSAANTSKLQVYLDRHRTVWHHRGVYSIASRP